MIALQLVAFSLVFLLADGTFLHFLYFLKTANLSRSGRQKVAFSNEGIQILLKTSSVEHLIDLIHHLCKIDRQRLYVNWLIWINLQLLHHIAEWPKRDEILCEDIERHRLIRISHVVTCVCIIITVSIVALDVVHFELSWIVGIGSQLNCLRLTLLTVGGLLVLLEVLFAAVAIVPECFCLHHNIILLCVRSIEESQQILDYSIWHSLGCNIKRHFKQVR